MYADLTRDIPGLDLAMHGLQGEQQLARDRQDSAKADEYAKMIKALNERISAIPRPVCHFCFETSAANIGKDLDVVRGVLDRAKREAEQAQLHFRRVRLPALWIELQRQEKVTVLKPGFRKEHKESVKGYKLGSVLTSVRVQDGSAYLDNSHTEMHQIPHFLGEDMRVYKLAMPLSFGRVRVWAGEPATLDSPGIKPALKRYGL